VTKLDKLLLIIVVDRCIVVSVLLSFVFDVEIEGEKILLEVKIEMKEKNWGQMHIPFC